MSLGLAAIALLATSLGPAKAATLLEIREFSKFTLEDTGTAVVMTSMPIDPGMEWDEVVLSWDVMPAKFAVMSFEVRVLYEERPTKYYMFAGWTPEAIGGRFIRSSVLEQGDRDATMATDTLILKKPARELEVRICASIKPDFEPGIVLQEVAWPRLVQSIHLSFRNSKIVPPERPSRLDDVSRPLQRLKSLPRTLDVTQKFQFDYKNGPVLCSPTSLGMILAFWNRSHSHCPALPVDQIAEEVFDAVYDGYGNWAFNTAFAASLPNMSAAVVRLNDMRDLEDLIGAGIPVACSVSYALLKGKPAKEPDDGHLVVLVGFDENGNPIFNDPGRKEVRQTYRRDHFRKAWATSGRTIYLIHPDSVKRPRLSVDLP